MGKKNARNIVEGIIYAVLSIPVWLPIILLGLVALIALPFVRCYEFFCKITRKKYINLPRIIKVGLSLAFLGACGYGIFFVISISINNIGANIFLILMILILISLVGYFGFFESIIMVRYPNIPQLILRKNISRLIRALKYEDRGIRREAAEALKDIGDERATKALEEYYDELAVEEDLEYNKGRPSCLYF